MHELDAERRRLLAEHAALEAEHAVLHKGRHDHSAHVAHIAKLKEHQSRLRSFHDRLRKSQR